jgi:hypothetical protein
MRMPDAKPFFTHSCKKVIFVVWRRGDSEREREKQNKNKQRQASTAAPYLTPYLLFPSPSISLCNSQVLLKQQE